MKKKGSAKKTPPRIKVAILGGGAGALSAAFWLSCTPRLRARYEVTVYTQGWRLGGKGASGRNMEPGMGARIEEHGLHMMMGFYDTVFKTIRASYAAMRKPPDAAFQGWDQAFEPQRQVTMWMQYPPAAGTTDWQPWTIHFPSFPGTPGEGPLVLGRDTVIAALWTALENLLGLVLKPIESVLIGNSLLQQQYQGFSQQLRQAAGTRPKRVTVAQGRAIQRAVEGLQGLFDSNIEALLKSPPPASNLTPLEAWKLFLLADVGLAAVKGFFKDRVYKGEASLKPLNQMDFKDWLRGHGAHQAGAESCLVMCVYDLAFAYKDGDSSTPANGQAAAGAILLLLLRMAFNYRDAPLWKMCAGMGDAIFTPLYRLLDTDEGTLEKNGVRFEFFRRARALTPDAQGNIASIDLDIQAETLQGRYRPLLNLAFDSGGSWDCWPSQPLWSQLRDGSVLREKGVDFEDPADATRAGTQTLELGKDFDRVILAIPPAAAAPLTTALMGNAGWARMIEGTSSIATQSVQLWLKPDLAGLGWTQGPTVSTGYVNPLRSWGEMSQVLGAEQWPPADAPHSCEYLCGTLMPMQGPEQQAFVAQQWLEHNCRALWPDACTGTGPQSQGLNPAQLVSQYCRANVAGSELYVQTLPGSVESRLDPGASGFANLYLAGDWTVTSINGGCAEAAFESGLRAACAAAGLRQPPEPDLPVPNQLARQTSPS